MNTSKVWLFRGLTLVGAGLMLVSWLMPWWSADIAEIGSNAVTIRPWGLDNQLGSMADVINKVQMPAWFAPFMWAYLGICIVVLLVSLFAKEKKLGFGKIMFSLPQWLVGGVGFSYIVCAAVAAIYASMSMSVFNVSLIGYSYIDMGDHFNTGVEASLLVGYWLAWAVGIACIVLGLLRNKIVGEAKLNASR